METIQSTTVLVLLYGCHYPCYAFVMKKKDLELLKNYDEVVRTKDSFQCDGELLRHEVPRIKRKN